MQLTKQLRVPVGRRLRLRRWLHCVPRGAGRETHFDTRIPIITKTTLYPFCSLLRSPTSCAAARKPHRTHGFHFHVADFTFMWRTESPSSYACGDESHIPAKTRNLLIPFPKRIRALRPPQKRNDQDRSR